MASDDSGLMNCNRTLLYEFNIMVSIVLPFPTLSETLRVERREAFFFFRVPILMASVGGGLDDKFGR